MLIIVICLTPQGTPVAHLPSCSFIDESVSEAHVIPCVPSETSCQTPTPISLSFGRARSIKPLNVLDDVPSRVTVKTNSPIHIDFYFISLLFISFLFIYASLNVHRLGLFRRSIYHIVNPNTMSWILLFEQNLFNWWQNMSLKVKATLKTLTVDEIWKSSSLLRKLLWRNHQRVTDHVSMKGMSPLVEIIRMYQQFIIVFAAICIYIVKWVQMIPL